VCSSDLRPHAAHGLLMPGEAASFASKSEPITIRQKGDVEPTIRVTRQSVRGDLRLFYLDISIYASDRNSRCFGQVLGCVASGVRA